MSVDRSSYKGSPHYTESVRGAQERRPEQGTLNATDRDEQIRDKNDELNRLRQQHVQQKDDIIREKEQIVVVTQYENNQLRLQLSDTVREKDRKDRQLESYLTQQLDYTFPYLDLQVHLP